MSDWNTKSDSVAAAQMLEREQICGLLTVAELKVVAFAFLGGASRAGASRAGASLSCGPVIFLHQTMYNTQSIPMSQPRPHLTCLLGLKLGMKTFLR